MSLKNLGRRIFKKKPASAGMSEAVVSLGPPAFDIKKWQVDCTISINGSTPHVLEIVPTPKNTKRVGANWLIEYHNDQHSEHGEDGIIAKIFELLKPTNKWVCEFGAHDPEIISNTWRLINKEGWNAVLIEADDLYFEKLQNYYKDNSSVHCIHSMVDYEGENILDNILQKTPAPKDVDFMVIDIDGNDHHVWNAIEQYAAKVLMIEFNASIPVEVSFVQEKKNYLNHGTSIKAMTELAAKKGYKLIAATSWNAFFVKNEYYNLFFDVEPRLDDMYVFPAKHPITMRPFQLYDGTLMIAPWNEMLWHKINLKPNDYQVLPESFRFFSRDIYYQEKIFENNGSRICAKEENQVFQQKVLSMPGNKLATFAANQYSQYGEDGILAKLLALVIAKPGYFVDIGAWNGVKNSRSRCLATNNEWSGLLVEHDLEAKDQLIKNCLELPNVKVATSFERKNLLNIDDLLGVHSAPINLDVMFINVYGMEYYIWESLNLHKPKILLIQFNPTIHNDVRYIQPKDVTIHQGCSLRALTTLASAKGYKLVATTLETAFFVKEEYYFAVSKEMGILTDDLDQIFAPAEMMMFQLYDGTIALRGLDRLMWSGIRIDEEQLQVVPKAMRRFHQFADKEYKKYYYRI